MPRCGRDHGSLRRCSPCSSSSSRSPLSASRPLRRRRCSEGACGPVAKRFASFISTTIDSTNAEAHRLAAAGRAGSLVDRGRSPDGGARPARAQLGFRARQSLCDASSSPSPRRPPAASAGELCRGARRAATWRQACFCREVGAISRLKWPNDVLIDGAKFAGHPARDRTHDADATDYAWRSAAASISRMRPRARPIRSPRLRPWVSAATPGSGSGGAARRVSLTWLGIWDEGRGFDAIRAAWLARAARLGSADRLRISRTADIARALSKAWRDDGALILALAGWQPKRTIHAGEVQARGRDEARSKFDHSSDLVLLPLGGIGEIGMNCYCYGVGPADDREWLMVDLGVKFGDETEPGIDVVLPDLASSRANARRSPASSSPMRMRIIWAPCPGCGRDCACPSTARPSRPRSLANKLKEAGLDEEVPVHVKPLGGRVSRSVPSVSNM